MLVNIRSFVKIPELEIDINSFQANAAKKLEIHGPKASCCGMAVAAADVIDVAIDTSAAVAIATADVVVAIAAAAGAAAINFSIPNADSATVEVSDAITNTATTIFAAAAVVVVVVFNVNLSSILCRFEYDKELWTVQSLGTVVSSPAGTEVWREWIRNRERVN